ncbi:MAG TPA: class I SAM-dependent methyltransferase, partial [Gemmataceae bacterium]|nr:class I SAM-dependent methyltransferase [Gemmataceae bacterium]
MAELNLLDQYPRSKRPIDERASRVTDADRAIARQFGRDYFDGDRIHGYGGYHYHPRFWQATVRRFRDHYGLKPGDCVLDVGCAKGFMLHDFKELIPGLTIAGIDISEYAIAHAKEEVKPFLRVGNAKELPYDDRSFDLVVAINTI